VLESSVAPQLLPHLSPKLLPHGLSIALIAPQIAPNTGNIARLCVATGSHLHLVRPLGFVLSEKELRRSAMDYWPRLSHTVHDDLPSFLSSLQREPWLLTTRATRSIWDATFQAGDTLVFGNEGAGLPESVHQRFPARGLRIPQAPGERCLNLSTAAGIALYEALRQLTPGAGLE
jgi:tRNA (cytidine/uridine-2'-O-)-methyltransferase